MLCCHYAPKDGEDERVNGHHEKWIEVGPENPGYRSLVLGPKLASQQGVQEFATADELLDARPEVSPRSTHSRKGQDCRDRTNAKMSARPLGRKALSFEPEAVAHE